MTETINIYALKRNDEIFYIGKTESTSYRSKHLNKAIYFPNQMLVANEIKNSDDVEIVVLKKLPVGKSNEWYDEKLKEVVEKHKENHPLVNAEWMKKGYRGYWQTKKRDAHTIKRLSESKFKKLLQYDLNGVLIKIWNSRKEAAIKVFKDYEVVNGSACSHLYKLLRNKEIRSRISHNSYWICESEIKEHFNITPTKLNFKLIIENQKKERTQNTVNTRKENVAKQGFFYSSVYTVKYFNENGKLIKTFDSAAHCAKELNISEKTVKCYCKSKTKKPKFNLKYGKKKRTKNYI